MWIILLTACLSVCLSPSREILVWDITEFAYYSLYAYRTMDDQIETIQGACRTWTAPVERESWSGRTPESSTSGYCVFACVDDGRRGETRTIGMLLVWIVDCSISYWCVFSLVLPAACRSSIADDADDSSDVRQIAGFSCRQRHSQSYVRSLDLRLLLWFVIWKTQRDNTHTERESEKRKRKKLSNERKRKCVCVCGYPAKSSNREERARWASFLSHRLEHRHLLFLTTYIKKEQETASDSSSPSTSPSSLSLSLSFSRFVFSSQQF